MTRASDSTESGLASAQKQAEDQTRCLLEAKEQLQALLFSGLERGS